MFSPVTILGEANTFLAVGLGPVVALPKFQRQGIGSKLIWGGLEECRQSGYDVVVVLGSPVYYQRFGFSQASHFGLRFEGAPVEDFMVLELHRGALCGKRGVVKYQPEFDNV